MEKDNIKELSATAVCPYCGAKHTTTFDTKPGGVALGKETVGLCSECACIVILNADRTAMSYPSPTVIRNAHETTKLTAARAAVILNALIHFRPRPHVTLPDDFPPELREYYDNEDEFED